MMSGINEIQNYTNVKAIDYVNMLDYIIKESVIDPTDDPTYMAIITFTLKENNYRMYVSHVNNQFGDVAIHHLDFCSLCGHAEVRCGVLQPHSKEVFDAIEPLVRLRLLFKEKN